MPHEPTFADSGCNNTRRKIRKEFFVTRMDNLMSLDQIETVVESFKSKAGKGRTPYPLSTMFRIHCMQHWYNMSDLAMEDTFYEITPMRFFLDCRWTVLSLTIQVLWILDTYWKSISSLVSCSERSINGHPVKGFTLNKGRFWMPPLLMQLARLKIKRKHVIQRCTRLKKVSNGSSGKSPHRRPTYTTSQKRNIFFVKRNVLSRRVQVIKALKNEKS